MNKNPHCVQAVETLLENLDLELGDEQREQVVATTHAFFTRTYPIQDDEGAAIRAVLARREAIIAFAAVFQEELDRASELCRDLEEPLLEGIKSGMESNELARLDPEPWGLRAPKLDLSGLSDEAKSLIPYFCVAIAKDVIAGQEEELSTEQVRNLVAISIAAGAPEPQTHPN